MPLANESANQTDQPGLTAFPHHLHNYGPGTRFGASSARIGCDVCVSHSRFRFSYALECRSAITVVFLALLIEAGLVLYSSLIVFSGQVSSGSAGYLPFVRLTDQTSASSAARSDASSTSSLRKSSLSCSCPKCLWTLPVSITSCLKPRKAGHFPKAGAVPSVFSFRQSMSPK